MKPDTHFSVGHLGPDEFEYLNGICKSEKDKKEKAKKKTEKESMTVTYTPGDHELLFPGVTRVYSTF